MSRRRKEREGRPGRVQRVLVQLDSGVFTQLLNGVLKLYDKGMWYAELSECESEQSLASPCDTILDQQTEKKGRDDRAN